MSNNNNGINDFESDADDEHTVELDVLDVSVDTATINVVAGSPIDTADIDVAASAEADINTDSAVLQRQLDEATATIASLVSKLELKNGQIDIYRQEIFELRKAALVAEGPIQARSIASNGQDESESIGQIRLLVADNEDAPTEYVIKAGRTCLGSGTDNEIQLKNQFVSRHHAQIVSNADACILGDLNSTNGTFVNSNRIKRHALQDGDSLTIGNLRFKYIARHFGNRMPAAFSAEHEHIE